MSGKNQHITPYSAADIQRYLKGELSASESHDLERAALEDPFLADAIEGMALYPTLDPVVPLERDLSDLRERLNGKATGRKQLPFFRRPVPVAAALILLLGIATAFFFLITAHKQQQAPAIAAGLAETPGRPPASSVTANKEPAAASKADSNKTRSHALATAGREVRQRSSVAATADSAYLRKPVKPNPAAFAADSTYLAATRSARQTTLGHGLTKSLSDTLRFPPLSTANATARYLDTMTALRGVAFSGDRAKSVAGLIVYRGIVTDQLNRPIPGATVSLNNLAGFGTTTDANGLFNFKLLPADSVSLLTISRIGYDKQFMPVNTLSPSAAKDNIIRLTPQTANFDEVVVVGYGAHRKETKVASPFGNGENVDSLWNRAAPVVGRLAYLEYIEAAKSKLGLDPSIHGTETVSFVVNRDGTLTSFKIEQSLSPAHDGGVVRLVTEGPTWHILGSRAARAAVTVRF